MLSTFKVSEEVMDRKEQNGPAWLGMPEQGSNAWKTQEADSPVHRGRLLPPGLSREETGSLSRRGSGLGRDKGAHALSSVIPDKMCLRDVSPFISSSRGEPLPFCLALSLPLDTAPSRGRSSWAGARVPQRGACGARVGEGRTGDGGETF